MTTKSAMVRARIEPKLKNSAEKVMDKFGITPTQAVRMLYTYVVMNHEWPFELKIPNAETRKTFEETDKGIGLKKYKNTKDLYNDLGI